MRKVIARLIFFPGAFIAVLMVQALGAEIVQRIIVTALYSESAYASGLRLSIKKGVFSNGDPVPSWALAAFLPLMLLDGLTFLFLCMLGARLAGEADRNDPGT